MNKPGDLRAKLAEAFEDRANELRELSERPTPFGVKISTRVWWARRRRLENTELITLEYTPPALDPIAVFPLKSGDKQT